MAIKYVAKYSEALAKRLSGRVQAELAPIGLQARHKFDAAHLDLTMTMFAQLNLSPNFLVFECVDDCHPMPQNTCIYCVCVAADRKLTHFQWFC